MTCTVCRMLRQQFAAALAVLHSSAQPGPGSVPDLESSGPDPGPAPGPAADSGPGSDPTRSQQSDQSMPTNNKAWLNPCLHPSFLVQ